MTGNHLGEELVLGSSPLSFYTKENSSVSEQISQFLGKKFPDGIFRKKHFTTEVLQSSPLSFSAILAKHNLTKPKYIWVFVKILFEKHQKMIIFGQKFGHWPNTKS